jgi:hypothetical protein
MEKLEHALKKIVEALTAILKRQRIRKIGFATVMLMFTSGIFLGVFLATVSSLYQTSTTISSVGTLKAFGIKVYWDDSLTSEVNAVDWGTIEPGNQKNVTVYVYNEGSTPITLNISADNWIPSTASQYISLSWNYTGQELSAAASMRLTLTLTVSADITGISDFSFDIIATGTG